MLEKHGEIEITPRVMVRRGILFTLGFLVYGVVTVLPAILSEGKINNIQELDIARKFAISAATLSSLGMFIGIVTIIAGVAKKYPVVKKILSIITLYSLFNKMVDNAVKNSLQTEIKKIINS